MWRENPPAPLGGACHSPQNAAPNRSRHKATSLGLCLGIWWWCQQYVNWGLPDSQLSVFAIRATRSPDLEASHFVSYGQKTMKMLFSGALYV